LQRCGEPEGLEEIVLLGAAGGRSSQGMGVRLLFDRPVGQAPP
jgi:hypothetical protein